MGRGDNVKSGVGENKHDKGDSTKVECLELGDVNIEDEEERLDKGKSKKKRADFQGNSAVLDVDSLVSQFADVTSSHALYQIKRVKQGCGRFVWLLFFLIAFFMMALQLSYLFKRYNSKDVDINIAVEYDGNMAFPAVSFCNVNPVR